MVAFSAVFVTILISSVFVADLDAALPNIACIQNYPPGVTPCGQNGQNCQFSNPQNVFVLACDDDCKANHNALFGRCDRTGICDCGPNQMVTPAKHSVQCLDFEKQEYYNKICSDDCKCAHNTQLGICNYQTKACQCRGRLHGRSVCPYRTGNELFTTQFQQYSAMGIPPYEFAQGYGK